MQTQAQGSQSSAIEIVECKTKAERRQLIDFQWEVYKGNQYWVPPLISEREAFYDRNKNPFFEHSDVAFFVAKRDGKVIGSIAAIHNVNHCQFNADKTGFFGCFETFNDQAVANALLDTARNWIKGRGLTAMRGPATFNSNDDGYGLLIEGFDSEPQILMSYNQPYYRDLLEVYGMRKAMDLYAWWASTAHCKDIIMGGRFERVAQMAMKRNKFTIRTADMSKFDEEVERIKKIYNKAWARNWGFVPMTEKEIDHLGATLKQVVDTDMVFIAEHDGEPVGVSISLPNLNRPLRKAYPSPKTPEIWTLLKFLWYRRTMVNSLRLIILGVLPEYRMAGIDTAMIYYTLQAAIRKNLIGGECSWVLETNDAMNRVVQYAEPTLYKKYRMYEIAVDAGQ